MAFITIAEGRIKGNRGKGKGQDGGGLQSFVRRRRESRAGPIHQPFGWSPFPFREGQKYCVPLKGGRGPLAGRGFLVEPYDNSGNF